MRSRQYARDILAPENRKPRPGQGPVPQIEAEPGLVAEDFEGRFCGAVVAVDAGAVTLEDRNGKRRVFPIPGTFLLDGGRVTLVRPAPRTGGQGPSRTASGSIAAPDQRAKVARASRIYVEGKHDAELVEQIWGDDLRDVGVVVEYLEGVDDLPAIVADFRPGRPASSASSLTTWSPGSKESRIAAAAVARFPEHVLVVGHPFIDIWAAVRPSALGLREWPAVPKGQPWKEGLLSALGWPCATPADVAAAWRRILGAARSYTDLDPALLGRVEELIDFVTTPEGQ